MLSQYVVVNLMKSNEVEKKVLRQHSVCEWLINGVFWLYWSEKWERLLCLSADTFSILQAIIPP